MTAWRQAIELSIGDEDVARLVTITRSRTEPASRVERARMLLAYREYPSFFAVAHALGVHHQTVQRCVERALAYGPMAALDDRPRSGKEPTITAQAKAWLVSLACRKAKELGYPHEVPTSSENASRCPCAQRLQPETFGKLVELHEQRVGHRHAVALALDAAFAAA